MNILIAISLFALGSVTSEHIRSHYTFLSFKSRVQELADSSFIIGASSSGLAEMRLAKLAKELGGSSSSQAFAQTVLKDHAVMNSQLTKLAQKRGILLSKDPGSESESAYNAIKDLKGGSFDSEFKSQMIEDHERIIAFFQQEVEVGKNTELTKWATSKLPALRQHLLMARKL